MIYLGGSSFAAIPSIEEEAENFGEGSLQLFDSQAPAPMEVNSAGQYAIKVADFPELVSFRRCTWRLSVEYNNHENKQKGSWEVRPHERTMVGHDRRPQTKLFTPVNTHCPIHARDL